MKNNRPPLLLTGILSAHFALVFLYFIHKSNEAPRAEASNTAPLLQNKGKNDTYQKSPLPRHPPVQPAKTSRQGTLNAGIFLGELQQNFPYGRALLNQDFATRLRKFLKTNPGARDSIASKLLDPDTPVRTFANLALVLGSMDEAYYDRILLQSLRMFRDEPDRAQWAVYALGVWRENPGWDQRFSFDSRGPMILQTTEGISTPVYHQIKDWNVLNALTPYMQHPDGDLRVASILTLRHSLQSPTVQEAFLGQLSNEKNPGNQAIIAEALARNLHNLEPAEKSDTIDTLLMHAANPGNEGIRLKVLHPLQSATLSPGQVQKLETLAREDAAPSVRRFALSLVSSQGNGNAEPQGILLHAAHNDPDPNIRAAVIHLIQQQPSPIDPESLIPILDNDSAWNVRYSTLQALENLPPDPEAAAMALNAVKNSALNDPDPKVSQYAMSILHGKR